MKKRIEDIFDTVTPEEMKMIEDELKNEETPKDINTDRIASLVSQKTGLDVKMDEENGEKAPEKNVKRAKILQLRRVLIAVAVIVIASSIAFGTLLFNDLSNDTSGAYTDGVITSANSIRKNTSDSAYEAEAEIATGESEIYYSKRASESLEEEHSWYGEADAAEHSIIDETGENSQIKASTLTAREYRDLDHIADFVEQLGSGAWANCITARNIYAGNIVTVNVKNDDSAAFNQTVELVDGQNVVYTAKTDVQGRAYLFFGITKNATYQNLKVRVDGNTYDIPENKIVNATVGTNAKVQNLDIMFMIDATGSMGDELEYIKVELKDVIARVAEKGANLNIRVSVNFYRDEGDEYIVKYYDFRSEIDECITQISREVAEGGGDYPEAVHTALDNAINGHKWREDAVKLCFFVLDAPAHSEADRQGVNETLRSSITKAAELGVRIIPLVASGTNTDLESLMRSAAVMTNGTYVYLTDESGIGGTHKQADVKDENEKQTEYLNNCLVRLITEYCGF